MYIVSVNQDICEGCGDCIDSCPVEILSLNDTGKAYVSGDEAECMGCESCVAVCESGAITITEY